MTTDGASFELTEHARAVLAERQIDLAWVRAVLASPQRTEADRHDPRLQHALGTIAERDGRILRVVYTVGEEPVRVVTAFFDRRERRPR
jgi:hypothetical protein